MGPDFSFLERKRYLNFFISSFCNHLMYHDPSRWSETSHTMIWPEYLSESSRISLDNIIIDELIALSGDEFDCDISTDDGSHALHHEYFRFPWIIRMYHLIVSIDTPGEHDTESDDDTENREEKDTKLHNSIGKKWISRYCRETPENCNNNPFCAYTLRLYPDRSGFFHTL